MDFQLECTYCGHIWERTFYDKSSVENAFCPRCHDSNLKVRDLAKSKVDGYVGCKPFPKKEEDDNGWPYGCGGMETMD